MQLVDVNNFEVEEEKNGLEIWSGWSVDPRYPGIILEMYMFKKPFKEKYPSIWAQIEEVFNDPSVYKYGIRHSDDDWGTPASITGLNFLVNRYGILFTKKQLSASREEEIDLDDQFYELYTVNMCTVEEFNLRDAIDATITESEIQK
jgi:hypothetical protein